MPDPSLPYCLHHWSEIDDLAARITFDDPSELIVVSGERASGRRYLIAQAAAEARRRQVDVWLSSLDLDGYEPDSDSLEPYVRFQIDKRGHGLGEDLESAVERISAAAGPDSLARALTAALILGRDPESDSLVEPALAGGLEALLAEEPDSRRLVLHVADVGEMSVVVRERLFAWAEAEPRVRPALSCLPTDGRGIIGPGREMARYEIQPLDPGELPGLVEAAGGDELSVEEAERIHAAAAGLAGVAARILDPHDSWRDPLEALESAPEAERDRIRTFLHLAALCGDNIPVRALARFLGSEGEAQEDFIDAVDESVGADAARPLLAERFQHPSFPGEAVYGFADPLTPAMLLRRIPDDSRKRLAAELLSFLLGTTPPVTRAAARLALELAVYAEAPPYRRELRRQLACWAGREESDELTRILLQEAKAEFRDPAEVWNTVNNVQFHWPAWRTLAALDAVRPEALHPQLRSSRSAVRSGLLLALRRDEDALAEADGGLADCHDSLLEAALYDRKAVALGRLGRTEEAEQDRRRGLEICDQLLEQGDRRVVPWMRERLKGLQRAGRVDEAEALQRKLDRVPAET